jgi:hypothetical protein
MKDLIAVVATLGDDEVLVLTEIARRLRRGADLYGRLQLAADKRDFAQEGREEIEDYLFYAACAWLKRGVR